jgi:hypothetical protein
MNKRETDEMSFDPSKKSPGSRRKSAATYRRRRTAAIALVATMFGGGFYLPTFGGTASAAAAIAVNEPPVTGTIVSFPSRDFISATDWSAYPFVDVEVLRNGAVVGFRHDVAPLSPTGLVEVNHPGSPCWDTVTPNIVGGDVIRVTGKDSNKVPVVIDQTTTAKIDITATLHATAIPGQVEMSGTAFNQDGTPMNIAELQAGALSGAADRFTGGDFAGKRIILALSTDSVATNGRSLTTDGNGNWTALWTELNAVDYQLALNAESQIAWLGGAPGSTTVEVGPAIAPGPFTPACNAPLAGPAVSTDVTSLEFPAGEVGTTSAASLVHVTNSGFGTDPSTELVVSSVAAVGPDANQFVVSNTCSTAPVVVGGSCDVSVSFRPTSTTPSQLKTALVTILSNAGNSTVSIPATGYALTAGQSAAVLVAKPANLNFGTRAVANTSPAQSVVIKNIGNLAANISAASITGAADFKIASQNCTTGAVAPLSTCSVNVTFAPASETARAATLNLTSNTSPLSVGLSGAGLITTNVVPFPHAPIQLNSFLDRDFVSLLNWVPGEALTVQVVRQGVVVAQAFNVIAHPDGVAEVNHPGGQCWEGTTPDLRPGDVLRVTRADGRAYEAPEADIKVEQRAVETSPGSGIVQVKGHARDLKTGGPLPLNQLNGRLISSTANPFAITGRRALTTGDAFASLTFDPIDPVTNPDGVNWTAEWDFNSSPDIAGDVLLAETEQNRMIWLGRDPLALAELSFSESGPTIAAGPTAPCTAPAEGPSAGIAVMTASNTFPALTAGDTGDRTYTVRNIGTSPLVISSITFAGANPADFSLVGAVPAPIAPNTNGTFTVRFSPTNVAVKGTRSAIIQINDNAVGSPHTSTASGLAVLTAAPSALMTPASLTFPDTQVGTSPATKLITVLNEGAANLTFSSIVAANTVPGTTAVDFSVVNGTTAGHCKTTVSLVADASCVIEVKYTPSAVNTRTATLTINSNDPVGAKVTTLSGTSSIAVDGSNDPPQLPIAIKVFPARDYVAAAGYTADEAVTISAYRNGVLIGHTDPITPDATGLVEANHILVTGCFATATPDLQAGDVIRAVAVLQADPTVIVSKDQIHVQGIEVDMPATQINANTVVMTGTAVDTFTGLPLGLGSFVPRITSSARTDFSTSGTPTLRAAIGLDGTVTMNGKFWTATFTGLTAADIQNAVTGGSTASWLGRVPLALNENSAAEWGLAPGPTAGCPVAGNQPALAPIPEPTLAPAVLDAGFSGSAVTGNASTNNVSTFTNTGTVALTGVTVGAVEGLNPGDFTRTTNCPATLNAGASCTVTVTFKATADGRRLASIPITHSGQNGFSHVLLTGLGVSTPTITAIAPAIAGRGATVTITGTLLTSTTAVTFSAAGTNKIEAATSFTVVNDNTLTAVIPANLSGTTNAPLATAVAVTTRGGTVTRAGGVGGLTVNGTPPTITTVAPTSGVAGNTVTITGIGFNVGGTTVTINGVNAVVAATPAATTTSISVVVPFAANTTGAAIANAPLVLSTVNGVATSRFTVNATPILTGFSVASAARGATISLVGTGFTAASTVTFSTATGTVAAAVLATPARSATSLSVVVPATAVQGPVTVNTTGFLSSSLEFVVAAAPTITSFTPTSGAAAATTIITVTGTNFRTASKVTVGGKIVTFTVTSPTTLVINGLDPATKAGGTINVLTGFGTVTSTATFTLVLVPTITTFTPTTATANVTTVSVTGTNYVVGATTVDLVQGATVLPQTALTVTATSVTFRPALGTPAGSYNIRITNVAGSATSVANVLIPVSAPTVSSFTPASATAGVTLVSVTGTSFTATSTVALVGATTVAQTATIVNGTSLTFTPSLTTPAGTYSVRVTNAAGSATSATTLVVSAPVPTIASFTPATATAGGTQAVTLTGTNFIAGTTVALVSGATTVAQTATIASITSLSFTPSATTAVGTYSIKVTNSAGTVTSVTRLAVVAQPTITSIFGNGTPGTAGQNGRSVTINGTNMLGTGSVTWTVGGVSQVLPTTTRTATQITISSLNVTTRGTGTISVNNGSGGVASIAFTVN